MRPRLWVGAGILSTCALAGCASLDGLADERSERAAPKTTDGAAAPAACDPSSPFRTSTALSQDTTVGFARWDAKRTSVAFMQHAQGDRYELLMGPSLEQGAADPFALLEDGLVLTPPAITWDGLTIYYGVVSLAQAQTGLPDAAAQLRVAHREVGTVAFHDPHRLPASTGIDYTPYLVGGANALYWGRFDPARADASLLRMRVDRDGDPEVVLEASGAAFPVVSADEKRMYYASAHAGSPDIFVTTRASVDVPFPPGVRVDELSTAHSDAPTWLSEDQCELVYWVLDDQTGRSEIRSARR